MKTLKNILILILIILLFGGLTAFIDYLRINNGKKPIFSISNYNKNTKVENYLGLFHKVHITYSTSVNEPLGDANKISYEALGNNIRLKDGIVNKNEKLTVTTKDAIKCLKSKLVYADKEIKIYKYCLDDIKINSYGKDYGLYNYLKKYKYTNLINKFTLSGVSIDKSSLELIDNKNITNNGLKILKCDINNVNDIYIGPANMTYQDEFCTSKDDDFYFMWEIKDENNYNIKCTKDDPKEVLYEDEINRYEFDCERSSKIYVYTPGVRGKEETNTPIKEALDTNLVNIKDAINRGLKINIINKEKEKAELEKKKQQEAAKQQAENNKK